MADTSLWQRAQELFERARDRPAAEREALLDRACADDVRLRAEVESLLRHHDAAAPAFLEPPFPPPVLPDAAALGGRTPPSDQRDPLVGKTVGDYQIRRVIASGGMGTVYLAEQEQPHRLVALKLLRAGLASQSAMRRFEYESEILARLRHPNIAQVYEAGTHLGLPYFVMEYIEGAQTITDYAADRNLLLKERLRLFEQVCDAIHYGHQRGVIHRDLKPGNILVDTDGRVRVIDFGVARATDADITLTTLHTGTGELVGTLQYMSPEQCDGDPHEIDVRSDVYSLGVVLYELLCGRSPYNVTGMTVASAARVICEQVPPRPSSVTGKRSGGTGLQPVKRPESGRGTGSLGGSRTGWDHRLETGATETGATESGVTQTAAAARVRGDLERIVLKSLEKDRRQRYQSAADLLRDIRHYLNREPIEARPPTLWTRAVRWAARRPVLATTAVCLVIAVCTLAVTATTYWFLYKRPYEFQTLKRPDLEREPTGYEARLMSRANTPVKSWHSESPYGVRIAALLPRPPELGGGRVGILAFGPYSGLPRAGALFAIDVDGDLDKALWVRRVETGDIPRRFRTDRGFTGEQFSLRLAAAIDVFPDRPGTEIIAVFDLRYSLRLLRIYDLRGDTLYQFWHDGGISSFYWMKNARLLILAGDSQERHFADKGEAREGTTRVRDFVVFAVRPRPACILNETLPLSPGDDPNDPLRAVWIRTVCPESVADKVQLIRVSAPAPSYDAAEYVEVSIWLDKAGGPGVSRTLDRYGEEDIAGRSTTENYKLNLKLPPDDPRKRDLPDPNDLTLGPYEFHK